MRNEKPGWCLWATLQNIRAVSSAAQITAKAGNGASCRPHTNPDTAIPTKDSAKTAPGRNVNTLVQVQTMHQCYCYNLNHCRPGSGYKRGRGKIKKETITQTQPWALPSNKLQMSLKEMKLPNSFSISHVLVLQLPPLSQLNSNKPQSFKCYIMYLKLSAVGFPEQTLVTVAVWTYSYLKTFLRWEETFFCICSYLPNS